VVLRGYSANRRVVEAQQPNEQTGGVEIEDDWHLPRVGPAKNLDLAVVVDDALGDLPLAERLANPRRGQRHHRVQPRAREIPARERDGERDGRIDGRLPAIAA